MRIATRFTVAVHIIVLLGVDPEAGPTSEYMAGSIGTNPVVVRNVTGMLKRAGLVTSSQGKPGAYLARPLDKITLLDVYRAVEADPELFAIHENPHPDCPVGSHIQGALEGVLMDAQRAMEQRLDSTTMEQIVGRIRAAC
jgi:DNA-binding IscR family transcriptional regulator